MRLVAAAILAMAALPGDLFARQAADAGQVLAVRAARLIDGTGAPPVADPVVLIRDGRIEAVGSGLRIPAGAEGIKAALPGDRGREVRVFPEGGRRGGRLMAAAAAPIRGAAEVPQPPSRSSAARASTISGRSGSPRRVVVTKLR